MQVHPLLDPEQTERAEADRDEEDDAEEEWLPERVQIEDEEQIADGAEHEGAEDGADRAAGAAVQRGAAYDHGRDRAQRIAAAQEGICLARIGEAGEQGAG